MDEDEIVRRAMAILGSRTSEKKKRQSRLNAKQPRKRKKPTVSKDHATEPDSDYLRENI